MLHKAFSVMAAGGLAFFITANGLWAERTADISSSTEPELLKQFAVYKHAQYTNLAERLDLNKEEYVLDFFEAAMTKEWTAVSNAFVNCLIAPGHPKTRNAIWAPVHETYGAYEEWHEWKMDAQLLRMFYEPILSSLPDGGIYFGGTDPGRFLITTVQAVQKKPDIVVVTQNALADSTYSEYLRLAYDDRVWMPELSDAKKAFQSYVEGVKSGKYDKAGTETVDGRVTIKGVAAVMRINGIIAKMIFDNNKDGHGIYIEESYVVPWMYPYLIPHGLIFKLNSEPLDALPDDVLKSNREFWDSYTQRLLANEAFGDNPEARKAFSKLRLSHAGLMAGRKLYDEAEYGFRQSLKLCPESPEANFRLADMYKDAGDIKKAVSTIESFLEINPDYDKGKVFLKNLKKTDPE